MFLFKHLSNKVKTVVIFNKTIFLNLSIFSRAEKTNLLEVSILKISCNKHLSFKNNPSCFLLACQNILNYGRYIYDTSLKQKVNVMKSINSFTYIFT